MPDLSAGLYEIPAGGEDPRSPRALDEIHYVCAGRATFRVGDEDRAVGPRSLVFMAARIQHRFHSIQEDLAVPVVFGPAEDGRA